MKNRLLFLFLLTACCCSGGLSAQTAADTLHKPKADNFFLPGKHSVYAEFHGNGIGYTLNFETIKPTKEGSYLTLRAGVGVFSAADSTHLVVPLTIGKLYIKNHYFLEVGVGVAPYFNIKKFSKRGCYITGLIAYRRNILNNKYYFKLGFSPYMRFVTMPNSQATSISVSPDIAIAIGKYF